jgi:HD superfamily phosphodiesterase
MQKMIEYSNGNLHDINHFIKVWAYAKTIAEGANEGVNVRLNSDTLFILEVAAITHDIACPLCREKYGNTNGKYQEIEGEILVREFLKDCDLTSEQTERVAHLVAHHHTFKDIDGIDYQILIEADYIVNAEECNYSKDNIKNFSEKFFKTTTGINLLKSIYGL